MPRKLINIRNLHATNTTVTRRLLLYFDIQSKPKKRLINSTSKITKWCSSHMSHYASESFQNVLKLYASR